MRYRHRYLDLICNREVKWRLGRRRVRFIRQLIASVRDAQRVRPVFEARNKVIAGVRDFLNNRDFIEVRKTRKEERKERHSGPTPFLTPQLRSRRQ